MGTEELYLKAYGRYLIHGGTPDGFMNLTTDDILIMSLVDEAVQKRAVTDQTMLLAKVLPKVMR